MIKLLSVTAGLLLLGLAPAPLASQRKAGPAPARPAVREAQKHERSTPFAVGETLTYDVSWSSYLTAGSASLRVAEKKPSYGSVAYYIVAEGRPTPLLSKLYSVYYKVDTLLDAYSLLPQRASLYSEEGKRHRMKSTVFDHAKHRADYQVETRTVVKKTVSISGVAQDPLGALYVLRSIPLKQGDKITIPICDAGTNYKVLIEAGPTETVKTALGSVPGQRLTITPPGDTGARALVVWMSTDAARVPLKMSAQLTVGAFVLTLVSRK